MRVLFYSTAFPQPVDPLRSPYNLHRCHALARQHELIVVSPVSWMDRLKVGRSGRPDCVGRLPVHYPTFFYPAGFLRASHAWWMRQSVRRYMVKLFHEHRPDVVVSYWTYPDGEVASTLAASEGIPSVAFAGGSDVLLVEHDGTSGHRARRVFERVDAVVTVSDDLKNRICGLGVPASKVHVLPAAVDTTTFSPGNRLEARRRVRLDAAVPVFVWVGRMVAVKGLDVLLDTCRLLKDTGLDFRVCLIGDGPLKSWLSTRAAALGLRDHVLFPGRIAQGDLPDWYRAADLAVLPSLSEGTPNVLLEAHACRVPFVASAVGGIPAMAIAGFDELVPPSDVPALASALRKCLDRRDWQASSDVDIGGWDENAARLSDVLIGVVRSRRSGGEVEVRGGVVGARQKSATLRT